MFPKPTFSLDIGSLSEEDLKKFKQLGQGACRTVFAYDDEFVLKVDRNRNRRTAADGDEYFYNQNEWRFWESIKHSPVSRFFFPVIEFDPKSHFLLMERAKTVVGDYGNYEQHPQYLVFRDVISALRVSDMGPRNAGVKRDGTLAALDYGFQNPASPQQIERAEKFLEAFNVEG